MPAFDYTLKQHLVSYRIASEGRERKEGRKQKESKDEGRLPRPV